MIIWRLIIVALTLSSLSIPVIFADIGSIPEPDDVCAEKYCNPHEPPVRFPFRLQGKQPVNCGYNSSYTLYCDNRNRTVLELPSSSIKFLVNDINYKSQTIKVRHAEACPLKHLRNLDTSAWPFQFSSPGFRYTRYTLFNCSLANGEISMFFDGPDVSCLNTSGYKVQAIPSDDFIQSWSLELCTKMYDTRKVSEEIFEIKDFLNLTWSVPGCKRCEVQQGGICRWKNGTNNQIDCYGGKNRHCGGAGILSYTVRCRSGQYGKPDSAIVNCVVKEYKIITQSKLFHSDSLQTSYRIFQTREKLRHFLLRQGDKVSPPLSSKIISGFHFNSFSGFSPNV